MIGADKHQLSPEYVFSAEQMPSSYDAHSLIYPNPLHYKRDSILAKGYYTIADTHRFGVQGMHQKQTTNLNVESTNSFGGRAGSYTRRAHDIEKLQSYGADYHYAPQHSSWLNTLNLSYTHHEVSGIADTWIYERDVNKDTDTVNSLKLSHQEYRPTKTLTKQSQFSLTSLPFAFGKLGEHTFKLTANHLAQDYTISGAYLGHSTIASHLSFPFVDAKKTAQNISLIDTIYINDKANAILGIRYDDYTYRPYYQDDVFGFSENKRNSEICGNPYNETLYCQLHRSGKGLSDSKFNHLTWSGLLNFTLIPNKLVAHYKIGSGFLAPTVTQIYSHFEGLGARQVPNYYLKPETSLNQELGFVWTPKKTLTLSATGYLTQYKDFIHTRYWSGNSNGCTSRYTCLQSVNLDEATVKGIKLGVAADLSERLNTKGRLGMTATLHTAKDDAIVKTDTNNLKINTLAAVPTSLLFGLDYTSAAQDWQLHARMNFIQRKKAKNTKFIDSSPNYVTKKLYCKDSFYVGYCNTYGGFYDYDDVAQDWYKIDKAIDGYVDFVDTYKESHRSKSVMIYDFYGSKKFGKNQQFTLNAGVYNITNVKYIPWENLRQFASSGTNNSIDKDGHGFNRYTATGRNFAVALTYEF